MPVWPVRRRVLGPGSAAPVCRRGDRLRGRRPGIARGPGDRLDVPRRVVCGAPIVCLIGASYVTDLTGGGQLARAAVAAALLLTVIGLAAGGLRASTAAQLVL